MSARASENVTESGSNIFSVDPGLAGVTRSGTKRLIPPDSDAEEPPAYSFIAGLPDNQGVGTSPPAKKFRKLATWPSWAGC